MDAIEGLLRRLPSATYPWLFACWTPAHKFRLFVQGPGLDHTSLVFMTLVDLLAAGCGSLPEPAEESERKLRTALFTLQAHQPRKQVQVLDVAQRATLNEVVNGIQVADGGTWLFVYEDGLERAALGPAKEVHKDAPLFTVLYHGVHKTNRATAEFDMMALTMDIAMSAKDTVEQEEFYEALPRFFVPLNN